MLGLLGLAPATAYELVQRMKTGTIPLIWPRAESKVYEEPKRLVADGLAVARTEDGGRAPIYEITDRGRDWLAAQLAEPDGSVTFESEAALKVLFADHGTRDELLANIRAVRDDHLDRLEERKHQLRAYAESPTRPDRAHLTALVGGLVTRLGNAVLDWADWAEQRVEDWDHLGPTEARTEEAKATMRSMEARADDLLRRHRPSGDASS